MSRHFYFPDRENWEMSKEKPGELAEPPPSREEELKKLLADPVSGPMVRALREHPYIKAIENFIHPKPWYVRAWGRAVVVAKVALALALLLPYAGVLFIFSSRFRKATKEEFRKKRTEALIAK